jgi:hypothetical protein
MDNHRSISDLFSVKQLVVVALLFMIVGTITELFLLHHYEGFQQLIPVICIGTSLVLMGILSFRKTELLMNAFKLLMGLSALSGLYGTFLHLQANFEFEQEMKPTASFWDLLIESLSGALPTLAPGSMIVFALIGITYITLLKQNDEE